MRILVLSTALVLSACGEMGGADTDAAGDLSAPAPTVSIDADIVFPASQETVDAMIVGEGLSAAYQDDGIVITGRTSERNSAGTTSGAAFVVDETQEAEVGGHTVTMKIVAKGPEGSQMLVAYSTNERGNSNWKQFELTPDFAEYSFDYDVKSVLRGRGDYLGVIPLNETVTIATAGLAIGEALPPEEPETEAPAPETEADAE